MKRLLIEYGIPMANMVEAMESVYHMSEKAQREFLQEFNLERVASDMVLPATRFAVDAIHRGADTPQKVVAYVAKRLMGNPTVERPVQPTVVSGPTLSAPVGDTGKTITATPVQPNAKVEGLVVKGRRGRKKLGNSDFCKAVGIIESNLGLSRKKVAELMVAANIKESSANVYLWRYHTKGERE